MSSNTKIKKFPYFYTVLVLCLVVGVCIVAYALSFVKAWMSDFDSTQPQLAAQQYFDEKFKNPDFEAMLEEKGYTVPSGSSKEELLKYIKEQIGDGEINYKSNGGNTEGTEYVYGVYAGDYKFATFKILDSDEKTNYGNPLFVRGDYEFFYYVNTTSVTVVAPNGATVSVNGKVLDESYITKTEETLSCQYMPGVVLKNGSDAEGIKYHTYYYDGMLYSTDDVKVVDKDGVDCVVEKDEKGVFHAKINYREDLEERFGEDLIFFTEETTKYANAVGNFFKFYKMMDQNSDLYTKWKNLEYWFVHAANWYEIIDQEAFEFYEYAPGVISGRIKITWHAKRYNGNPPEYYDYIDTTVYLHEVNGEYKVYEIQTHAIGE